MLARLCSCESPQVFEDSETCNTCGRTARVDVSASTWRLALALAEIAHGRRHGTDMGRNRWGALND